MRLKRYCMHTKLRENKCVCTCKIITEAIIAKELQLLEVWLGQDIKIDDKHIYDLHMS